MCPATHRPRQSRLTFYVLRSVWSEWQLRIGGRVQHSVLKTSLRKVPVGGQNVREATFLHHDERDAIG
jgi:hypothetical protein